jgi:hypothetical protein
LLSSRDGAADRYQVVSRAWIAFGGSYGSRLPAEFKGTIQDAVQQFGPQIVERVNFDRGRVRPSLALDATVGADLVKKEHMTVRLHADIRNFNNQPHQFCVPFFRSQRYTSAQLCASLRDGVLGRV